MNDFLANGGDGYQTLWQVRRFRQDTGLLDADVFMEYLRYLHEIREKGETRIEILE